jgi:hypothetical protein
LDVRFPVECVFKVIFTVENLKLTLKTHATVKRSSKVHIQNASLIDLLGVKSRSKGSKIAQTRPLGTF